MRSFKYIFYMIAVGIVFQPKINADDAVITFFIKEQKPEQLKARVYDTKVTSVSLVQPSFIRAVGKDRSWLHQPGVDGLQASYLGYIMTSDKNGQVTFPRHQQNDTMYLLVTPEIEPEFMINPTLIHHWITKHNRPLAFYEIARKKNKKLNVYYFEVKKMPIPHDIPMNTITIYAHPDHIQVPLGISLNTYSTNFILPELQAKKIDTIKNSLYTLSIKQYFEHINIESKNDGLNIATMVMNR